MHLRRYLAALAGLLLGALIVLALPAAPASAHANLVRTSPVQGSVVQDVPSEVVITFSEVVVPVPGKVQVLGPDGKRADRGDPKESGTQLHIPLRSGTPRGTYVVSYRVISADSHPVGAGFTYSVGAPSQTPAITSQPDTARTDPVVSTIVSALNYLSFAGLILVVGPALVLAALWPARLSRRGPTRLAMIGAGVLAGASLLELYVQAPYATGGGLFQVAGGDLREVLVSRYGLAHLIRLGMLAAALYPLRRMLAGRAGTVGRTVLVLSGVVGVATWGIAGHPSTSAAPTLTVVADTAHLASVAIWIGGLVMLFGYLLRRANGRELGAILPVWSNWATLAVTVLVLAGVAQALIEIGTVNALLHTAYGQLLMVKVGVLALVLGVAAFSRRLVLRRAVVPAGVAAAADRVAVPAGAPGPAPDGGAGETDGDGATADGDGEPAAPVVTPQAARRALRRLRGAVLAELLGAVLILGLTSVLVQTAPARTAEAAGSGPDATRNGLFSTTLTSRLYQLQIDIEPVQTGPNDIHLYAYTPAGAPLKVLEWHASAALPAQGVEPVAAVLTRVTDAHEIGQITLPTAGQWQFSFTLRTTEFDEATVTAVVKIT